MTPIFALLIFVLVLELALVLATRRPRRLQLA
jgi:hypothetical protein